jgi:Rrf2 family protein
MKASKRCHYALRALVDLGIAQALGRPLVRIGDLSQKENLPTGFLEQIFIQLRRAGFIESKRGSQGGYQLAVPASEISFGAVIRLIEGTSPTVNCDECGENAACPYPDPLVCGLRSLSATVNRAVAGVLDHETLGNTVRRTLGKIRRNKIAVPFVKMVMKRTPRKRTGKTASLAGKTSKTPRTKARRKPIRKRQAL